MYVPNYLSCFGSNVPYFVSGSSAGAVFCAPLQEHGWRLSRWFLWKLRTMPHCNNPNNVGFDSIKKSIGRDNNLPVGKFWKFRYDSSRFRKVFKPSQDFFGLISKTRRRRRFILPNVRERREKLGSGRRGKADLHKGSLVNSESASARTSSRSYPSPISISLSPLAKRRRSSFSCSDFS
jgi:hypothetical protein